MLDYWCINASLCLCELKNQFRQSLVTCLWGPNVVAVVVIETSDDLLAVRPQRNRIDCNLNHCYKYIKCIASMFRADSKLGPSQWETALLCNDISHWLGANLESTLMLSVTRGHICLSVQYFDHYLSNWAVYVIIDAIRHQAHVDS